MLAVAKQLSPAAARFMYRFPETRANRAVIALRAEAGFHAAALSTI